MHGALLTSHYSALVITCHEAIIRVRMSGVFLTSYYSALMFTCLEAPIHGQEPNLLNDLALFTLEEFCRQYFQEFLETKKVHISELSV